MIPKKKLLVCLIAIIVGLGLLAIVAAGSPQEKASTKQATKDAKDVTTKAETRASGTDANIKDNSETNNPNMQEPAPPEKGGPKSRGGGPVPCHIRVDNRTPWLIRIYIDGNYRGVLPRFGDLYGLTGNGPTTAYGLATFVNAPNKSWGPQAFRCPAGGIYTWHLYQ